MKHYLKLILLCLCLLAGINALAYDAEIGGIYYNFHGNNAEVTFLYYDDAFEPHSAYSRNIVIPESVTYYGKPYSVTSIGYGAFYYCSDLTSVTIPNSVTSIGSEAFFYCI